ncbi:MAG: hypothetical protein AB3N63_06370 [Puniceicoccaceae bacterium]
MKFSIAVICIGVCCHAFAESIELTVGEPTGAVVSPYLVGANIVYSHEDMRKWDAQSKDDVLLRAGMSNLRYPGGHVVSYWDWEFPYHSAYANFWDPGYIEDLTEARRAELLEENQHRMSLDDYLDTCQNTGALPLIGINMFQGYRNNRLEDSIAKAVRLVNYCKDRISGPRYYYLDNEAGHQPTKNNHVPTADYISLIPDYSTAIKEADPEAKIIVNIMQWNQVQTIVRDYGDYVDLYDQHWYYNNLTWGEFWLEEWRKDVQMGDYTRRLDQFNDWIDTHNKPHLKIGFLEWNIGPARGENGSTPGSVFYQGLVQADMLMHMINFDVYMGSIWPLTWADSFRNLIDGPDHEVAPTLHIHRAFSKAGDGAVLSLNDPGIKELRSLAVKSADDEFIDLYFLNKSTESIELDVVLPEPAVETTIVNFAQGVGADKVSLSETYSLGNQSGLQLVLGDTSFTYVRCRISGNPQNGGLPQIDIDDNDNVSVIVPDFEQGHTYKLLSSNSLGDDVSWQLEDEYHAGSGGLLAPLFELSLPTKSTFYRVLVEAF